MTTELAVLVRLPVDELGVRSLLGDIRSAKARADKAMAGDRLDVVRYEALSTQLEQAARRQLAIEGTLPIVIPVIDHEGHCFFDDKSRDLLPAEAVEAGAWITAGDVAVEVRMTLKRGTTPSPPSLGAPLREPADPWPGAFDAHGNQLTGSRAVAERFRQQLQAAIDGVADATMMPSGVSNSVLTESLRHFVGQEGTPGQVDVTYRDGSVGPRFPVRCLNFRDEVPTGWRTFRFAMLSIRHTEMDVAVDGAWLRNTDISRPRPAGDTDRIAYELSCQQLKKLCKSGPVLLYLYQTGLDTAVVGIYRAVTEYLVELPHGLALMPMYFRRQSHGDGTDRAAIAGYEQQSTFVGGTPWVV